MSKILEYLKSNKPNNIIEKNVEIERFKNEKGEYMPFKIRSLTSSQYADAMAISGGSPTKLPTQIVIMGTVEPNLQDISLQEAYGTVNAKELAEKIFKPGEMFALSDEILRLSGFGGTFFPTKKELNEAKKH